MSRILIVEDNPRNLKLVRDVLQVKGYATLEAGTAEEGIRIAGEERKKLKDIAAALRVSEIHFGAILEDLADELERQG